MKNKNQNKIIEIAISEYKALCFTLTVEPVAMITDKSVPETVRDTVRLKKKNGMCVSKFFK